MPMRSIWTTTTATALLLLAAAPAAAATADTRAGGERTEICTSFEPDDGHCNEWPEDPGDG